MPQEVSDADEVYVKMSALLWLPANKTRLRRAR
jgi:hypothetical protein